MANQDSFVAKITIPFVTLFSGLTLTGGALLFLLWSRNWQVPLDDSLKLVATGVGITTALYAALNLARLNRAHTETVELKKLELTAKFIERWQDPKTVETCLPLGRFIRDNRALPSHELANRIDIDESLNASALFVLNTLEALAVAIKYGALHVPMAHAFFRGVVTTYYSSLSGLVAMARTRKANGRLYIEVEQLSNEWSGK